MKSAISGKTLRWTFDEGPMAGKTFEHTFGTDGTVSWKMLDGERPKGETAAPPASVTYQVAQLSFDVFVVTYQSKDYTLTTVLDFKTALLVAVASKPGEVTTQRGSFEAVLAKAA